MNSPSLSVWKLYFWFILSFKNVPVQTPFPIEFRITPPPQVDMDIFCNQTLFHTAISAPLTKLVQQLHQWFKVYFLYGCFPIDNSIDTLSYCSSLNSKLFPIALNPETFYFKLDCLDLLFVLLFISDSLCYCVLPLPYLDNSLSFNILIICASYTAFYITHSGKVSLHSLVMLYIGESL